MVVVDRHPQMKAAGFVEVRAGKGSHLSLKHPLSNRILRQAGVE
jgi:predicted RNA binding protein YcfA (HicA-like mRNA interferase family)